MAVYKQHRAKQPTLPRQWIWPLLINASVWLLYFLWNTIFDYLSFFVYPFWLIIIAVFTLSFSGSLLSLIRHKNRSVSISVFYLITAAIIVFTHAFNYVRYDFRLQSQNYKRVAQLAELNKLPYIPAKGTKLPSEYWYLSEDGYISVHKEREAMIIEFVTDPGIMFSYDTITFISNDRPPETCLGTPLGKFERIEAQWYRAACWNP